MILNIQIPFAGNRVLPLFSWPAALLIGCALVLLFAGTPLRAQTGTADSSAWHFWYFRPDARSSSLAGATVSDPLNRVGVYANPAQIAMRTFATGFSVNTSYLRAASVAAENVTVPLFTESGGTMMAGATFHHPVESSTGYTWSNRPNFRQIRFDLAYAQIILPRLSVGLGIQGSYGSTDAGGRWTGNATLGFYYSATSMLSYGLVYRGTGYRNDWLGSGLVYYRNPTDSETRIVTVPVPHRLELGATLRFPAVSEHPEFILSFSNEKLFGQQGLVYRGGLEFFLSRSLILRGGYFYSNPVQGARLGGGLLLDPVEIDYSFTFSTLDRTGSVHQLSLQLAF